MALPDEKKNSLLLTSTKPLKLSEVMNRLGRKGEIMMIIIENKETMKIEMASTVYGSG